MKKVLLFLLCSITVGVCAEKLTQVEKASAERAGDIALFNKDKDAHTFEILGPNGFKRAVRVTGYGHAKIKNLPTSRLSPDKYTIQLKSPQRSVVLQPGRFLEVSYGEGAYSRFNVENTGLCSKSAKVTQNCNDGLLLLTNKDDAPHTFSMTDQHGKQFMVKIDGNQMGTFKPVGKGKQRIRLALANDEAKTKVVLDKSSPSADVCYDDNQSKKIWDCSSMTKKAYRNIW